jgi:hypothetical protein
MATINDTLSDVNNALASLEIAVSGNLSAASNAQKIKGFPVADLSAMPDGAIFRYNSTSGEIEPLEGLGDFSGAQDGDLLKWNATNGRFEVATPSDITFAVEDLSNTPNSLTGNANRTLVLNSDENAFQFRNYSGLSLSDFEIKETQKIFWQARISFNLVNFYKAKPLLTFYNERENQSKINSVKASVKGVDPTAEAFKALLDLGDPGEILSESVDFRFGFLTSILNQTAATANDFFIQFDFDELQSVGSLDIFSLQVQNRFSYRLTDFAIYTIDDSGSETLQKTISIPGRNDDNISHINFELSTVVTGVRSVKIVLNSSSGWNITSGIQIFPQKGLNAINDYPYSQEIKTEENKYVTSPFLSNGNDLYILTQDIRENQNGNLYKWDSIKRKWVQTLTVETAMLNSVTNQISYHGTTGNIYHFTNSPLSYVDKRGMIIVGEKLVQSYEVFDISNASDGSRLGTSGYTVLHIQITDQLPYKHSKTDERVIRYGTQSYSLDTLNIPGNDLANAELGPLITPKEIPELQNTMGEGYIFDNEREFYLPLETAGKILVISTVDLSLLTQISVGSKPHLVKIDETNNIGVSLEEGAFTTFNPSTKSVLSQEQLGQGTNTRDYPVDISFNPNKQEALILMAGSNRLLHYDMSTTTLLDETTLNGTPQQSIFWEGEYHILLENGTIYTIEEI